MPFGQRMRFRPRFRGTRRFSLGRGRLRPIVHRTRNRFEQDLGPTTGGTETPFQVVSAVEAPTNRGDTVRAGSILRSITVQLRATANVAGKHQALLVYRPAAENVATPIASYWDATDPLTEEGVKLRRLAMSRCQTIVEPGNAGIHPHMFSLRWRGIKQMYDGDDVSVWILDAAATTYNGQVWTLFTD